MRNVKKKPEFDSANSFSDRKAGNIWKSEYKIRTNEIDAQGKLSVPSLCNLMQEAAGEHSESFGISMYDLLAERNLTWVLSRLKLKVNSYPVRKDIFRIQTWPSAIKRHFVYRDFQFMDWNNRTIGHAVTVWPIIDAETRRPVSPKPFAEQLNIHSSGKPPALNFNKLPKLQKYGYEYEIKIRYYDIDMNQHVNYVSCIEWIIESIPHNVLNSHQIDELEINYLAEIIFGDSIILKSQPATDNKSEFYHSIVKAGKDRELVRAKTVWRPID